RKAAGHPGQPKTAAAGKAPAAGSWNGTSRRRALNKPGAPVHPAKAPLIKTLPGAFQINTVLADEMALVWWGW
ncbi:MAG: hypothetical protein ACREIA_14450, partial [Opitutaceae bacterium]